MKGAANVAKIKKSTGWLLGAVLLAPCAVLNVVSAVRSSGDSVALGLSIVAVIGFVIAAFGFSTQWSKERSRERGEAQRSAEDSGHE